MARQQPPDPSGTGPTPRSSSPEIPPLTTGDGCLDVMTRHELTEAM